MRYALLILAALALGCSHAHPGGTIGLPRATISRATVPLGMTEGEVLAKFGWPNLRRTDQMLDGHRGEAWSYGKHRLFLYGRRVVMVDGEKATPLRSRVRTGRPKKTSQSSSTA